MSLSAGFHYGFASADAHVSILTSNTFNAYTVFAEARADWVHAPIYASGVRLIPRFAKLLRDKPAEFRQQCGDEYINGAQYGAQFIADLTINTTSEADENDVAASLNANMSGIAAGGSIDASQRTKVQNIINRSNTTFNVVYVGDDPTLVASDPQIKQACGGDTALAEYPHKSVEEIMSFASHISCRARKKSVVLTWYANNYPGSNSIDFASQNIAVGDLMKLYQRRNSLLAGIAARNSGSSVNRYPDFGSLDIDAAQGEVTKLEKEIHAVTQQFSDIAKSGKNPTPLYDSLFDLAAATRAPLQRAILLQPPINSPGPHPFTVRAANDRTYLMLYGQYTIWQNNPAYYCPPASCASQLIAINNNTRTLYPLNNDIVGMKIPAPPSATFYIQTFDATDGAGYTDNVWIGNGGILEFEDIN